MDDQTKKQRKALEYEIMDLDAEINSLESKINALEEKRAAKQVEIDKIDALEQNMTLQDFSAAQNEAVRIQQKLGERYGTYQPASIADWWTR